jgi:hypothetical protein
MGALIFRQPTVGGAYRVLLELPAPFSIISARLGASAAIELDITAAAAAETWPQPPSKASAG